MVNDLGLGIVPHTGWAWVVALDGPSDRPRVQLRERVVVRPVLEAEVFHRAAAAPADRAAYLRREMDKSLAGTEHVLRDLATRHDLGPLRLGAAAVIGKPPPRTTNLDRVLASHVAMHGAEGELWRTLFVEACLACDLRVMRAAPGDLRPAVGADAIDRWLRETRVILGPPWTKEVKEAAVAAWSLLEQGRQRSI